MSLLAEAGGGWPQKKGSGYFKLNQYILRADTYFNPEGNKIDVLPRIGFYSTSIYAEYGVTDKITAIVFAPVLSRITLNELVRLDGTVTPGDALNSLGDMDLSVKYGLARWGNTAAAISLTLGLPLGNPSGGATGTLQTGDGEFNQMLSLDVGHSLEGLPIYLNGMLAFNNRTENLSDEIRFGAEVGLKLGQSVLLTAKLLSVNSLENGDLRASEAQSLFSNNIEYTTISPEINLTVVKNLGLSSSVIIPLSGRQVLGNPAWNFGVFWELD